MAIFRTLLLQRNFSLNGVTQAYFCALKMKNPMKVNLPSRLCSQLAATENIKTTGDRNHENSENGDEIKTKILNAALNFVHEFGWNQNAISSGAESLGYSGISHGMFPNGGVDLAHYYYRRCNDELNKILQKETIPIQQQFDKKRVIPTVFVYNALKTRLRMNIPYKTTWAQAMALMSLPYALPQSIKNLSTMIDDVCYHAGDRSVSMTWYTRRTVLASIYKITELYMLEDNSEDHIETWQFLERRINETAEVEKICSFDKGIENLRQFANLLQAAVSTTENMIGFNNNK